MSQMTKILIAILSGLQDKNISFSDLKNLLIALGFSLRIKGDHFIFTKQNIAEIINLQPENNKAKAYQVKQVRKLIVKYKLGDLL